MVFFAAAVIAAIFLATGSLCWFQAVLGVPCPACGTLRAAEALLGGQFALAHEYHPLILLTIAICIYAVLRQAFFRKKPVGKKETCVLICVFALYMAVFAVRMFLLFPHTSPLVPLETALWRILLGLPAFIRG